MRDRLLTLVDNIEKETGQLAVAFAEDGTLTHPRLIEALHQRRNDGDLLRLSIGYCFVHPQAAQHIKETWPSTVKRYQYLRNSEELIGEKATVLATFVLHNLYAATETLKELDAANFGGIELELTQEQEILVKLEEAACWYRVIDELAYGFIREYRPLFVDYFMDELSHMLALQGVPPDLICRTMAERSQEYAQYREWASSDVNRMAGTLLWKAGKRVGVRVGLEHHFMFNTMFGTLFLMRVKQALVYELLTGEEKTT
jgi:hypothetical protein